jgi:hypothetical protein
VARQTLWGFRGGDCEYNFCDMARTLRMGKSAFRRSRNFKELGVVLQLLRYVPDGSLCAASVEQIFPCDCVQRNYSEFALYITTASPIASVRVFETVRVTQMSSRYVRCARNAVGARSRDFRAERSSVLGICFWPFIVRQHAPIDHSLLARPRPHRSPYRASGFVLWHFSDLVITSRDVRSSVQSEPRIIHD